MADLTTLRGQKYFGESDKDNKVYITAVANDVFKGIIGAINDQKSEVDELKAENERLRQQLEDLTNGTKAGINKLTQNQSNALNAANKNAGHQAVASMASERRTRAANAAVFGEIKKGFNLVTTLKDVLMGALNKIKDMLGNSIKQSLRSFSDLSKSMRQARLSGAQKDMISKAVNDAVTSSSKAFGTNVSRGAASNAFMGLVNKGLGSSIASMSAAQRAGFASLVDLGESIEDAYNKITTLSEKQIQKEIYTKSDLQVSGVHTALLSKFSEVEKQALFGGDVNKAVEEIRNASIGFASQIGGFITNDNDIADLAKTFIDFQKGNVANMDQKKVQDALIYFAGSMDNLKDMTPKAMGEMIAKRVKEAAGNKGELDKITKQLYVLHKGQVGSESTMNSFAQGLAMAKAGSKLGRDVRGDTENKDALSRYTEGGKLQQFMDKTFSSIDELTNGSFSELSNALDEMFGGNLPIEEIVSNGFKTVCAILGGIAAASILTNNPLSGIAGGLAGGLGATVLPHLAKGGAIALAVGAVAAAVYRIYNEVRKEGDYEKDWKRNQQEAKNNEANIKLYREMMKAAESSGDKDQVAKYQEKLDMAMVKRESLAIEQQEIQRNYNPEEKNEYHDWYKEVYLTTHTQLDAEEDEITRSHVTEERKKQLREEINARREALYQENKERDLAARGFWEKFFDPTEEEARERKKSFFTRAAVGYTTAGIPGAGAAVAAGGVIDILKNIKFFENGGVVDKPTNSVVGENGKEVIFPLTKPDQIRKVLGDLSRNEKLRLLKELLSSNKKLSTSLLSEYIYSAMDKGRSDKSVTQTDLSKKILEGAAAQKGHSYTEMVCNQMAEAALRYAGFKPPTTGVVYKHFNHPSMRIVLNDPINGISPTDTALVPGMIMFSHPFTQDEADSLNSSKGGKRKAGDPGHMGIYAGNGLWWNSTSSRNFVDYSTGDGVKSTASGVALTKPMVKGIYKLFAAGYYDGMFDGISVGSSSSASKSKFVEIMKLARDRVVSIFKSNNQVYDGKDYNTAVRELEKYQGGRLKPAAFVNLFGPIAREDMRRSGIPASVTLAQAALETGWGKTARADFRNLFGIKGSGDAGSRVVNTHEVYDGISVKKKDAFAQYSSYLASIEAHSKYLLNAKRKSGLRGLRYGEALAHIFEPNLFAYLLREGGYATSTSYGAKLVGIMKSHNLYKYDLPASALALQGVGAVQQELIGLAKQNALNPQISQERLNMLRDEEFTREVIRAQKEGKPLPRAKGLLDVFGSGPSSDVSSGKKLADTGLLTDAELTSLANEAGSLNKSTMQEYIELAKGIINSSSSRGDILAILLEIAKYLRGMSTDKPTPVFRQVLRPFGNLL